jgi:hypothetical protein
MTRVAIEREFRVSAKALFHVLFGDKSAVFQMLYRERWAQSKCYSPATKVVMHADIGKELSKVLGYSRNKDFNEEILSMKSILLTSLVSLLP